MAPSSWSINGLPRTSTTMQVTDALRDGIVTGRIPQGAALKEVQLSAMLGTGRTPIREALAHLAQEGLVVHELHRGARVRILGDEDVRDIYAAREAIESFAGNQIIERTDALDVGPIALTLATIKKESTGRRRPSRALIAADICFHQQIVDLVGSRRLSRAYGTLAAEARMVLLLHPVHQLGTYAAEHEAIFELLERRDPGLPQLLVDHLRESAKTLLCRRARDEKPSAQPVA